MNYQQQQSPPPPPRKRLKWGDIPGWIQVTLGVLTFFGVTGAALGIGLDPGGGHSNNTVIITQPSTVTPSASASLSPSPSASPSPPPRADPGARLVGTWSGSGPLSAYESTSFKMTIELGDDGRYAWVRDAIHDSGYWELDGGSIAFEQDAGGQYEWPYALSGEGGRQVLSIVTEQGGTTRLRRA